MQLTGKRLDHLNIVLMVGSCAVAYVLPFELFLFSYAVLGPLHYLTEISWLHDRKYFSQAGQAASFNRNWLVLVGFAMAAILAGAVAAEIIKQPISPIWEVTLFYLVFVTALLITVRRIAARAAIAGLALLAPLLLGGSSEFIVAAFLLLTVVHVFIFTGAFILHGALRNKSASGVASVLVFVACAASFFVWSPELHGYTVGEYVRGAYRSFNALNAELMKLFDMGSGATARQIYESDAGLAVMRFIAYAYTYHYLNWFSKTSIIKWHEVPRKRVALIMAVWLSSLVLFARDYDTGMIVLYLLSILHVMLEFPLNHRTFVGIGRELFALAAPAARVRAAQRHMK